jgi:hypothetical protein
VSMERPTYPMSHDWHVSVNQHQDRQREAGKDWSEARFMYEAMHMADEVPRMALLFKAEREDALPKQHQQCSMQAHEPVKDNHLSCCRGGQGARVPALACAGKDGEGDA